MTQWYLACLLEVEAFLDRFQGQDRQVVRIDSDLVAALTGVLQGAAIQQTVLTHLVAAGQYAELLSSSPSSAGSAGE